MQSSCILNYKKSKKSSLFLMVPHSGRYYGNLFKKVSKLTLLELRKSEDNYIDLLIEDNRFNFNYIKSNFPRIYVDVNRSPLEIDFNMWKKCYYKSWFIRSLKVRSGIGVIPKVCYNGKNIYKEIFLFKEARHRLLKYYFPYHKKIKDIINEIKQRSDKVIALDCHSMPSEVVNKNVDIVLSNNNGKSSSLQSIYSLKKCFNDFGYKVELNRPFKGGFITKYYGKPLKNIHVIQIEINKKIYLNEKDMKIKAKNFSYLKNCFSYTINYINNNINSI